MADKDNKKDQDTQIDPEKLKQLQQLMSMQMQAKGKNGQGGGKPPKKLTPKVLFVAILQWMSSCVKFVDQFINFVANRKTKNTNDVVDSARSPILFGTYVTVIFIIFGLTWSATAPLDSAAVAIGMVISDSNRKVINHQEGGVIKEIFVKLGDNVKKGDKLLEFDSTRLKSEYESVLNQYRAFLASESRLFAEINGQTEIKYPDFLIKDKALSEVSKIIETQNNLFCSKRDLIRAEKDSLAQRVKQLKKQIESYEAKQLSLAKNLEFIRDRVQATRTLSDKGFAQKAALLELEAKEAQAESEISMNETEIARSEQEITKTEIDLLNLDSKATTQALGELRDVQVNVSERREKFFALSDALDKIILKSPVDGVVNNINFHTIGSTIPGGQPIMEISPSDDRLIIEAKIPPKNIDSIRVGLTSKIRFSAFKSRTTPLFNGTVVSLSPDIVIDPKQQMDPKLSGGYYLARIELNAEEFSEIARTRNIELHPGMQAEVQIVTGTRTLLKYLLDPVFDAMFKGFKEK